VANKINGLDAGRPASASAGRVTQRSVCAPASPDSAAPGEVHITDTASHLAVLEQSVRDLPAVDEARVASLQAAIDQGSYQVASEQVAEKLAQFEQALNALPQSGS
jgi:negative regulator of flagellin synthesis FlgM